MTVPHSKGLAEKQRAALRLRLRRRQEEGQTDPATMTVSPVVPLRSEGPRPPLILVHAVGGSVAPYIPLVSLLDDDQPVYALEDPGVYWQFRGERELPALAADYMRAVREVCPRGPVILGGWSAGGAVALEMARGDTNVAGVLVLDTDLPPAPYHPTEGELRAWFAADTASMGAEPGDDECAARFLVFAANVRAFLAHRQERPDTRVVSLCAEEDSNQPYLERRRLFSDAVHLVPGNHYTMLRPPHIEVLAATVRRTLSEVGSA